MPGGMEELEKLHAEVRMLKQFDQSSIPKVLWLSDYDNQYQVVREMVQRQIQSDQTFTDTQETAYKLKSSE